MKNLKPITHHCLESLERPADWTAVRFKRHKSWLSLTWKDYFRTIEAVALGLLNLGVKAGDRVAVLANTRYEWAALDFGIMGIGAVTVPIYQSNKADEVEFVLHHSEARILVLEDVSQLRKWELIAKRCKHVERVVCIQPGHELPEGVLGWEDFLNQGIEKYKNKPKTFAERVAKNKIDDLASVVYTSGTTGEPKGVMITHRQILSEVTDANTAFPISPADSTLSFLPYAHVLGRVELWLHMFVGFTMNFAESVERLRADLGETKPTVLIGVPRIFEKIYAGLWTQIESQKWRKRIFEWLDNGGGGLLNHMLAENLVYKKLRQGLGGNLRFVVSGGAPLEPKLAEFFNKAGLLIFEGYGLTETTAAVCVNTPDHFRIGTVGRPMADVEVKIASDGEILLKSDKVMTGYYKNPEATAEVIKDGYLYTGDVGEVSEDGFVRITDRKKDLIKTSGGKYVAPQKLEGLLKTVPLVSQALIHGDRRKYIVALITLNEPYVKTLARENGWTYRDFKALSQLAELHECVRKAVAQVNTQLASFETIKNFAILPHDFTVESGELTPSLKVKRRICDERYKDLLDGLY